MPRPGDVVAGKYRIDEVIGEGGMGAVFAATHALTGKRVALKWMLPELAADEGAVQRFMREAQAAGRIDHPNVVDIYDVGEHEGSSFLVMEYLTGEPLTKALIRGGLEAHDVLAVLLPAMRGVAAAHAMGVVHRDLKPDNIFLCRGPDGSVREPKVLDFGISKVSNAGDQLNPRLTRTGAVMGTPYYMSPEQIRGSAEVDQRTDVYAFGVILYEALTGQVPFDADAYSALILAIATSTPRRPRELKPQLPQGLEAVVLKAMAREPEQRYQSVEELVHALEPFTEASNFAVGRIDPTGRLSKLATAATPFTAESAAARQASAKNARGLVIGVAVAALLGLGALAYVRLSRPQLAETENVVKPAVSAASTAPSVPAPAIAAAAPQASVDAGRPPQPAAVAAPAPVPALPSPLPQPSEAGPAHSLRVEGGHHRRAETPAAVAPAPAGAARPAKHPPGGRTGELDTSEF